MGKHAGGAVGFPFPPQASDLPREGLQVSFGGEESVNQADFYLPPPCFTPSHRSNLQSQKFRSWEEDDGATVQIF